MPAQPLRLKNIWLDDIILGLNFKPGGGTTPKATPTNNGQSGEQDTIQYIGNEPNPTITRDKQVLRRRVAGKHSHLISGAGAEVGIIEWTQELHLAELWAQVTLTTGNEGNYLPSLFALLQGCGYDLTTYTQEAGVPYRPTQAIFKVQQPIGGTKIDLRGYVDDNQYYLVQNALGIPTFRFPVGQRAMADFRFEGKAGGVPVALAPGYTSDNFSPANGTNLLGDLQKSKFLPIIVQGVTLTPTADPSGFGAGLDFEKAFGTWTIAFNTGITRQTDPTDATGFAGVWINDIDTEITFDPEVNDPEKWDTFINRIGATGGPFTWTMQLTTGANTRQGWTGATTYTVTMKFTMDVQYDSVELVDRDELSVWMVHLKPHSTYVAPDIQLDFTYT